MKPPAIPENIADIKTDVATLHTKVNIIFWVLGGLFAALLGLFGYIYALNGAVSTIRGEMNHVTQSAYTASVRLDALAPSKPENVTNVANTLQAAKNEKVKINLDVVQTAGSQFIAAAQENEAAWKAAISFVDYRSFLNEDYQPSLGPLHPSNNPHYSFTITVKSRPGATGPAILYRGQILASGVASPENSALYQPLDSIQTPSGFAFLLVRSTGPDDVLVLDDHRIKNVVIADSTVEYDGGPLLLENVYFVNCSFILPAAKNTRALGQTILESASVKFDSLEVHAASSAHGEVPRRRKCLVSTS